MMRSVFRSLCLVSIMSIASLGARAAMTTADAVAVLLNSRSAVGVRTYSAAWEIVASEARKGAPLQQFVVGIKTDDKELAARYLTSSREKIKALAEKRNNPLAWYLLSVEKNDFAYLKKAADGGNVQALNAYGTISMQEAMSRTRISTNALERILRSSYECFRKAASQRDPNGYINLGTCYQRGYGCNQDMGLAFICFKAAAEAGHPEGMDYVSACYQFGHGIEKNSELSLLWAMRGRAARGNEAAEKWLMERK